MGITSTRTRRVAVIITAAALAVAGVATVATAASISRTGTSVTRVATLTGDTATTYTGAGWRTVAAQSVHANRGQFILATFSAESACSGTGGWCSVRILIDGVEANPKVGTDFSFNEAESATSWESHSVSRMRVVTFRGTHRVVVQTAQVGGTTHRLDDWLLSALAVA